MEEELEAVGAKAETQRAELARVEAERRKLERIRRNLPRVAQLAAWREELAGLADVPDLPPTAREERLALVGQQRQLAGNIAAAAARIRGLEDELKSLHVPEALLRETDAVRRLNEDLGAVRKAADDLPKRTGELAGLQDAIHQLLSQARRGLTVEGAESIRLPKPQVKRIDELALRHAELSTLVSTAERSEETARAELREAQSRLGCLPPLRDMRALVDALQEVRREGNLQKELNESASRCSALVRKARLDADALPGWSGSLEALEALAVPMAETVQKYQHSLGVADQQIVRLRDRVVERRAELTTIQAEIARLHAAGEVPTPEQLSVARERRAAGWRLVRQAYVDAHDDVASAAAHYDPVRPLPEAYEASVAAADAVADRMRADAERVAADQSLRRRKGEADSRLAEARAALVDAERERERLAVEWRGIWTPLSVEALTPAEMSTWLESRRRIRETLDAGREEQRRHEQVRLAAGRCGDLLRAALLSIGESSPQGDAELGTLAIRGERCAAAAEQAAQQRRALEQTVSDCNKRLLAAEKARAGAGARLEAWKHEWSGIVAALGYDATASPVEVQTFVNLVEDALTRHQAARELERRIRRMEEDSEAFRQKVTALAQGVAPELAGLPPARMLTEITVAHQKADRARAIRTEKQARLDSLRADLGAYREQLAGVERGLRGLLERAGCSAVEQLEELEALASRKRDVSHRLGQMENDLLAEGGGLGIDRLVDETREQDGDRIATAIVERQAAMHELQAQRDDTQQALGELRQRHKATVNRTNASAQAAQEAEEELATIRAHAERYVHLRLAELVLGDFVERYRAQHQDPILNRASALFPVLTLDTFTAIRTDYDDEDRAVLVGIDRTGAALRVEAMSDGTRDQLYLALRLAAIEQYIDAAEPLPFVADDLLVHFDDERARAALRVLAELSGKTQVLFFTHHAHLVDLARDVIPASALNVQRLG